MAIMPAPTGTAVNLGAETKKMVSGVSEEGAQRIMALSINLYADPTLAVIREYIANAVDTTILAGTGAAVNVIPPTRLNPVLTITDFGTGMSAEELENNFLMFAASTKIDTNDQVGCLGVGAKSAWTIAESFTIDTVQNGKRNMVRASRTLTHDVLLDNVDTDAPNGTTISIPVDPSSADWNNVIYTVASAHAQGAVTIDGATVESIQSRNWIGPVSFRRGNGHHVESKVLSGGTIFDLPWALKQYLEQLTGSLYGATIRLDVGSFDFTPSRESLIDTQRTREALHAAARVYVSKRDKLQSELDELVEAGKFLDAVQRRAEVLNGRTNIPTLSISYSARFGSVQTLLRYRERTDARASSWRGEALNVNIGDVSERINHAVLVTGIPNGRKLRSIGRYVDSEFPNATTVILADEKGGIDLPVFKDRSRSTDEVGSMRIDGNADGISVVTYDTVMTKVKGLTAANKGTKTDLSDRLYQVYRYGSGKGYGWRGTHITLENLTDWIDEQDKNVRVVIQRKSQTSLGDFEASALGEIIIVISHSTYTPKPIIEEFPDHVTEESIVQEVRQKNLDRLTDDHIVRYAVGNYGVSTVYSDILDLCLFIPEDSAAHDIVSKMAAFKKRAKSASDENFDHHVQTAAQESDLYNEVVQLGEAFMRRYPLMNRRYSYGSLPNIEHTAAYVANTPPVEDDES